ncbi:MAG: hypothetical protein QE274_06895 [Verrucomicrobiaceae bacterium]|nr:hypothetical protein [Verrucomicrobiaceae bacterium]
MGLICGEDVSGILAKNAERPQEGRDEEEAAQCSCAEGKKSARAGLSDAVGRDDVFGQAQPESVAKIRPKSGTDETHTPSEKRVLRGQVIPSEEKESKCTAEGMANEKSKEELKNPCKPISTLFHR